MKDIRIGFVGLGSMGMPIASNLIKAGFNLNLHTRSRLAEQDKRLIGSKSFSSPKEAFKYSDIGFICVSDDAAVEEVLFGLDGGCKSLSKGSLVIDLSTISPTKARSIETRLSASNIDYIDAPVSGGTEGAEKGTLTIFLGCDDHKFLKIKSILEVIAKNIYCFGSVGKGQEVKLINQILVAGTFASVAEAIALGETLGLPMNTVVDSLQTGAANSWALSNRSQAMLKDKYPLGFKLELHHKDLLIALKSAQETGLKLPIASKVLEIENHLIKKGYGEEDVSVLRRFIRKKGNN